ncbi:hypothetical protein ABFX02_07G079900 [Erythranthe guttata]
MTRVQILFSLFLIWLSLQHRYAISSTFQETKLVSFKTTTAAYNLRNNNRITPRIERGTDEKKIPKRPSGPSPVGNHLPPSKA